MALSDAKSPGDTIKSSDRNNDLGGLSTGENDTDNNSLALFREEVLENFVVSGLGVNNLGGLNYSINSGVVMIDGQRIPVDASGSVAASANQDRYVYVDSAGEFVIRAESNGNDPDPSEDDEICVAKIVSGSSSISAVYTTGNDRNGKFIGRRSPHKLKNPCMFSAYRAGAYASSGGTFLFNAKTIDTADCFNTDTGEFTAPVSGYYQFNLTIWVNNTATGFGILYGSVQGEIIHLGPSDSSGGQNKRFPGSVLVHVDKGEKVYLVAFSGYTEYSYGKTNTFNGFLVHED